MSEEKQITEEEFEKIVGRFQMAVHKRTLSGLDFGEVLTAYHVLLCAFKQQRIAGIREGWEAAEGSVMWNYGGFEMIQTLDEFIAQREGTEK